MSQSTDYVLGQSPEAARRLAIQDRHFALLTRAGNAAVAMIDGRALAEASGRITRETVGADRAFFLGGREHGRQRLAPDAVECGGPARLRAPRGAGVHRSCETRDSPARQRPPFRGSSTGNSGVAGVHTKRVKS